MVGAAGCFYNRLGGRVSIFGPLGVRKGFRNRGIGGELLSRCLEYLHSQQMLGIYIGVKKGHRAESLYRRLGFERYGGVVMRKVFCSEIFGPGGEVRIENGGWCDFAEVEALMAEPVGMVSFDYAGGVFSSRYIESEKFLGVFSGLMGEVESRGAVFNIARDIQSGMVAGVCHIKRAMGKSRKHIGVMDFFVHDNYLESVAGLVGKSIEDAKTAGIEKVYCYCVNCDGFKGRVLESFDAKLEMIFGGDIDISAERCDTSLWLIEI